MLIGEDIDITTSPTPQKKGNVAWPTRWEVTDLVLDPSGHPFLLAEGFFALRHFNRPILDMRRSDVRLDHFILEQRSCDRRSGLPPISL